MKGRIILVMFSLALLSCSTPEKEAAKPSTTQHDLMFIGKLNDISSSDSVMKLTFVASNGATFQFDDIPDSYVEYQTGEKYEVQYSVIETPDQNTGNQTKILRLRKTIQLQFWSIIPPLLAIILALMFKNVFIALFSGCFAGYLILAQGNLLLGADQTLMSFIRVFEDNDNTIIIILVAVLGGLIYLIEKAGGINGFVEFLVNKRSLIKSKRGANAFTWIIGVLIFTSGTLSNLITGAVSRPLTDAMKVSHEKLSYMVHSTSTPVCVLIPLSGWGAFMIGLIEAQGVENGAAVLAQTIPLNFYALLAVFGALFFGVTGKDFGGMRRAEQRANTTGELDDPKHRANIAIQNNSHAIDNEKTTSALNLIIPILVMIVMIIAGLLFTGNGNILEGDGIKAILWGIMLSVFVAVALYRFQKIFRVREMIEMLFKGAGDLLSVAAILMFAFSMGSVVKELGAGAYLGNLFEQLLIPALLPAIIFLLSCVISFSTGTSMGSMAVIMPLAIPMTLQMEMSIPLVAAAVIGGSIFGDHSSPISDTTVLSCAATGCDIMDHVKTQLPYTLLFGGISLILFLITGFIF